MTNRIDDIWKRIDRRGDDECWPWLGYRNWTRKGTAGGYGRLDILGRCGVYAHRVAYLAANPGAITLDAKDGINILHSCDNPICCNPKHLFIGTNADNVADKVAKGRQPKYPRCTGPRCKFTEEDVLNIRKLKQDGATIKAIAMLYEVSRSAISHLVYGRSYKDVR